jgi:S1-C subfamily serine protease
MPANIQALSDEFAQAVDAAAPRVVAIAGGDGGQISGIVWRTGLIVTAHEALGGEDEVEVLGADGTIVKAEIAGRDPSTDVALLKAATADFGEWTAAATPAVGSIALLVGRSEHSPLAGFGLIAESGPAWRSMRGGDIDARLTLGLRLSSRAEGGAVITPDGTLIGMAVTGVRRRAIAIPAATVARAVKTLSEKGYVPRGFLGVSLHPLPDGAGAVVVAVEKDGPAAKGGLAIGDIVTTWNGEAVGAVHEVLNRLGTGAVGQTVKLGVQRGGNPIDLEITIGERPRG